jgi:hypothetical protein
VSIRHSDNLVFDSSKIDVSDTELVEVEKNGKYMVKFVGAKYYLFNECVSEYLCSDNNSYGGTFMKDKSGAFTATSIGMIDKDKNEIQVSLISGVCRVI